MIKKFYFTLFLFFTAMACEQVFSQTNICNYNSSNNEISDFLLNNRSENHELESFIEDISKVFGIKDEFILIIDNTYNNFAAFEKDGQKFILIDTIFLDKISSGQKKIKLSIIAHEIGHLILNHTSQTEYGNEVEKLKQKRIKELEADFFSSQVMYKLGYNLEDATMGINKFVEISQTDLYSTHPLKQKRNIIISTVYDNRESLSDDIPALKIIAKKISLEKLLTRIEKLSLQESEDLIKHWIVHRGIKSYESGNYNEAINELSQIKDSDDLESWAAKIQMALSYMELDEFDKAERIFKELEANDEFKNFDFPRLICDHLYFNMGLLYSRQNKIKKKIEYFEKYNNYFPNDIEVRSRLGDAYYQDRQLNKAKEIFNEDYALELINSNLPKDFISFHLRIYAVVNSLNN